MSQPKKRPKRSKKKTKRAEAAGDDLRISLETWKHAWIPLAMLEACVDAGGDCSAGALLTYIALYSWARSEDWCFPSNAAIAKRRGIGVTTVKDHLKELREGGLIARETRRWRKKPRLGWRLVDISKGVTQTTPTSEVGQNSGPTSEVGGRNSGQGGGRNLGQGVAGIPAQKEYTENEHELNEECDPDGSRGTSPIQTSALATEGEVGERVDTSASEDSHEVQAEVPIHAAESDLAFDFGATRKRTVLTKEDEEAEEAEDECEEDAVESAPTRESRPTAAYAYEADGRKRTIPQKSKPKSKPKQIGHEPTWPPVKPIDVHYKWAEEMKLANPGIAIARPSRTGLGICDTLAQTYDVDDLEAIIRVAVWDWDAIRATIETWYTKDKKVPTPQVILKIAPQLAATLNNGVVSNLVRVSRYWKRYVKGTARDTTKKFSEPRGESPAAQARREFEEERARKRAKARAAREQKEKERLAWVERHRAEQERKRQEQLDQRAG